MDVMENLEILWELNTPLDVNNSVLNSHIFLVDSGMYIESRPKWMAFLAAETSRRSQCFEPRACKSQAPSKFRTHRFYYTAFWGLETSSFCPLMMIGAFSPFVLRMEGMSFMQQCHNGLWDTKYNGNKAWSSPRWWNEARVVRTLACILEGGHATSPAPGQQMRDAFWLTLVKSLWLQEHGCSSWCWWRTDVLCSGIAYSADGTVVTLQHMNTALLAVHYIHPFWLRWLLSVFTCYCSSIKD